MLQTRQFGKRCFGNRWAFRPCQCFDQMCTVHEQKLLFPNFLSKFWRCRWISGYGDTNFLYGTYILAIGGHYFMTLTAWIA